MKSHPLKKMESVSIFPPPPGYSTLFSQEERNEADDSLEKRDSFALDPPEPADGQYVVFGEIQEVVPFYLFLLNLACWLLQTQTGIPTLPVTQLFDEEAGVT